MIPTMIAVSTTLFLLLLTGVSVYWIATKWALPVARTALEGYWSERWAAIEERLDTAERAIYELPDTWEDFFNRSKRERERVRWHVRRVKKELERHGLTDAEIDAIDGTLRPADGEGSGEEGLLPLHDVVAEVPTAPAPDAVTQALHHKWRIHG